MKTILAIAFALVVALSFFAGRSTAPRYELRTVQATGIDGIDKPHPLLVRVDMKAGTMCMIGGNGWNSVEIVNDDWKVASAGSAADNNRFWRTCQWNGRCSGNAKTRFMPTGWAYRWRSSWKTVCTLEIRL